MGPTQKKKKKGKNGLPRFSDEIRTSNGWHGRRKKGAAKVSLMSAPRLLMSLLPAPGRGRKEKEGKYTSACSGC